MFDKWLRYSYADQKKRQHRLARLALSIVLFFVVSTLFSHFLLETVRVENSTMAPGLERGDRLFVLKWGFLSSGSASRASIPNLRRGELVLVSRESRILEKTGPLYSLFRTVVRFFTAQRLDPAGPDARVQIKRVVGMPGDELSMQDSVCRIREQGVAYMMTEHELSSTSYDLTTLPVPEGWSSEYPLSQNLDPVMVNPGSYFLLSDDRSCANDSRAWGPVEGTALLGKAIFRYWPFDRIGRIH